MKNLILIILLFLTTQANANTVVQRQAQFIDRFNRANSSTDLGDSTNYTTNAAGLAVNSNHVIDSAADLTNNRELIDLHDYDDFIAEWDVYPVSNGFIGLVARATAATGTFYMFGTAIEGANVDVYVAKVELGSVTGFTGYGDLSASTLYHIKVVLQGTVIKIYVDGVLYVNTTDAAIASGADSMYLWFAHNSSSSYIDNFVLTSLD